MTRILLPSALAFACFLPSSAQAGIPECGNLRLEDVGSCEIKGDLECSVGCEELGIYKKACATKLHTVCRDTCVLDPVPTCTDECTVSCTQQCDAGVNITCQHNCFGECNGSCDITCENAADPSTCMASCEATCDGECDIQCAPLINGSCYEHCIECCDGSCGAQANMTCQTSCQEEQFETCELEFRADCSGGCEGEGALFCDGEFVLAGEDIGSCVQAIIEQGIDAIDLRIDLDSSQLGLCSVDTERKGGTGLLALFALLGLRRRRRS